MDNYEELLDYLDQWTAEEFFGGISCDNMKDETLVKKFNDADTAFWALKDFLERKAS